jgi:pimeloyl-ACP methyl ester carboxylesterase
MKLTYTRTGSPDAPAIVFLHGQAMGQWMWHDQIQHFADYDCYNVDLPGHGGSHQIEWRSFDQTADCVAQLIAEDIPAKPVYLVGMSLGAVVGLHLLARHAHCIEQAVLTGAFANTPPRWLMMVQGGILSALLPTAFGQRLFARMLQLPSEAMPYYQESITALSIPTYRRITQQIADYVPLTNLKAITAPTLFVTGEKDIAINRCAVTSLAGQVPESRGFYAPGGHHGWNGENPVLFNAMTRAWIEAKPLPQSLIPAL